MSWVEVFAVLLVSHLVGDFLIQTDWQATQKERGLGHDPVHRRALFSHVVTYMVCFIPALVWIAIEYDLPWSVLIGLTIAIPHLIQDDRRLLEIFMKRVKHVSYDWGELLIFVDQSFHVVFLFGTALLVVA